MRETTLTTALGALALAAPAALAQSHEAGSDGCGLGWAFTQRKSLSATSTRGSSAFFSPFGMTSGTLGCDAHSIAAKDMEAARFAVVNLHALRLEAAVGRGERLAALSRTMGCADADGFARTLKGAYADVFTRPGLSGVEAFKNIQAAAAAGC